MSKTLKGKCLCGACTVSLVPANDTMHVCHCDMCRAWSGISMMAIGAKPGTMQIDGPLKKAATSEWAERAWCDECGSGLYYHVTAEGEYQDMYSVPSGLFTDAGGLTLKGEYFSDKRPSGYAFAGKLDSMTEAETLAFFGG